MSDIKNLDFFNLPRTVVSKSLLGKTFLIYGTNRTGKSFQASKFPKPLYLAFERGLEAIAGIPYVGIKSWSDFISVMKQLKKASKQEPQRFKETYSTIVIDTIDKAMGLCEDYTCANNSINDLQDLAYGKATRQNRRGFWKYIDEILNLDLTIVFIGHRIEKKFKKDNGEEYITYYPKGDKQIAADLSDLVDAIIYLHSNGVDSDGKEILSTAYLTQSDLAHAGSRFKLPSLLHPFTAKGLEEALIKGIEEKALEEGSVAISHDEYKVIMEQQTPKKAVIPFDTLVEQLREIANKFSALGIIEQYASIVEDSTGLKGFKVSSANKDQIELLSALKDDLLDYLEEITPPTTTEK